MPFRVGLLRMAVTCLAAVAPGCAPASLPPVRNVVVVVLDATHAAHLGCYGGPAAVSPGLDALAARGARFQNAYANATWTLPSTVSLMSGLRPEHHGVITANQSVPPDIALLAEHLRAADFRTASYVQMVFASERHGLDRGFDEARYFGPREGPSREELQNALLQWARQLPLDGPSFLYVHLRRPHAPYNPSATDLQPFERGCALADGRRDLYLQYLDNRENPQVDADDVRHLQHLYRASLRHVDDELAQLTAALEPRLARDTVLVVTSDHGEGLGEHGDFGHGTALFEEHVHIPLIVVGPGIEPRHVADPVSTVDLMPTVLDLCGLPVPDTVDGRSWAPLLRGEPRAPRPVLMSARAYPPRRAAVAALGWSDASAAAARDSRRDRAVIVIEADGARRVYAWSDGSADGPSAWVPQTDPATLGRLEIELARLRQWRFERRKQVLVPAPSEQMRAHLRELGYLK